MGCGYQVTEYAGLGVQAMSVQERMTLANMAAELGAKTGIVAADEKTAKALSEWGAGEVDLETWQSDPGATYARTVNVDGENLAPQLAPPTPTREPSTPAWLTRYA